MAKAVLVMNMPESCFGCNFCHINCSDGDEYSCQALEVARPVDSNTYEKPEWCPLRELPERETEMIDAEDLGRDYVRGTMDGWNACLEEIDTSKNP